MAAHSSESVGFKRRLANYFERLHGDVGDLKPVLENLPRSYTTPEQQDTLMRFIADRCGVEEAEAVEELDYVTARLERERRNERFERLLEPWTTEQLEASLRLFFAEHDTTQLPTVSALVTFYRGREVTLIRELELQYRRPLLLPRDEEDAAQEASAMELAAATALQSAEQQNGPPGGGNDADNANDDDNSNNNNQGGSNNDGKDKGGGGDSNNSHGQQQQHHHHHSPRGGRGSNRGDGGALRIRTNWEDLTVDSMQEFELEILNFLLEIRQELMDRVAQAQTLAQSVAAATVAEKQAEEKKDDAAGKHKPDKKQGAPTAAVAASPKKKDAAVSKVLSAADKQSEELAHAVNDMSRELAALPKKRLQRVEKMMQIIPLIARAVTPIFKSQLVLYLGFYCSLRVEARKVMQKRLASTSIDAPMKAEENFQRRVSVLFASEKESRADVLQLEKRAFQQLDPLFFRERNSRLIKTLVEKEEERREEIDFDELCISSVARAKLRSLVFMENTHRDLNNFVDL